MQVKLQVFPPTPMATLCHTPQRAKNQNQKEINQNSFGGGKKKNPWLGFLICKT